jgi:hypothetical protein
VKGAFWALCSVLLVSAAQLLLRDAMQALPPVSEILRLFPRCGTSRPARARCCWG